MTDHVWSQEQIAAYLAGGLSSEESERLERHVKECVECHEALAAATHFDRGLGTLFLPLRPKPGLEDRAIRAVRSAPKRSVIFFVGWRRLTAVAAGVLALTTFGALTVTVMNGGRLPMPGEDRRLARDSERALFDPTGHKESEYEARRTETAIAFGELTNEDPGADSRLDKLADKTVDDIVKFDPIGVPAARTEATAALKSQGEILEDSFSGRSGATKSTLLSAGGGKEDGKWGTFNYNGPVPPALGYGNGQGFGGGGGGGFAGGKPGNALPGSGSGTAFTPDKDLPIKATTFTPAPPRTYFVPGESRDKPDDKALKDSESSIARTENGRGDDGNKPDKGGDKLKAGLPKPAPSADPKSPVGAIPEPAPPAPEVMRRVVLRSGDIEFEIESFDSALATVTKLITGVKGAFVGTVNSDKLPNGKVKGSVVVRIPPEFLDSLVLDLRKELGKGGELKSVKLASQDVTKQYTDLESRLKAARAMELRLLAIIKDGKGEIKQLLEAERELGVWRTKIEESEGELRYFANLAALSTLTITLTEKEIRSAIGVTENERVQAGVEVEDVDKAYQTVLKEVLDAKGRVTKSELKQLSAGQFNATLNFEVSPETGGPIRDRLRQLGRVARLEIDRLQQADGGAVVPKDAKVKRGDTIFIVQLYNLANIAARETATLSVAVPDVPTAYNAMRDAIAKAAGRVQVAQLNETDKQNITAQLNFDVKRTEEGALRAALAAAGDATSRQVARAPESDTVTDSKILYQVTLYPVARLRPRDSITQQVAVADVVASYNAIREVVTAAKGRILASQLDENDKQNVTASLDFEVRRADEVSVKAAIEAAGETVSRQISHAAENETATDTKVLYSMKLLPANRLKPRETTSLGLEVADVESTMALFVANLKEVKGRPIDVKSGRERNGKTTARLVYEVPLDAASGLVEKFKTAGTVRVSNSSRDPQAPAGNSATARIDITLSSVEGIVNSEDGLWTPVKKGLSYSAEVLLTSMTWVVFGLCVVLPWALVGYAGYRVVRRFTRTDKVEVPSAPVAASPS